MEFPNIDFSKAPHPSFVNSVLLFVPGLFLEMCILMGNPAMVRMYFHTVGFPAGPRYYIESLIALFVAFLLGGLADAWLAVIRVFLKGTFTVSTRLRRRLAARLRRKSQHQGGRPSAVSIRLLRRLDHKESTERSLVQKGMNEWAALASAFIKRRFGIEIAQSTLSSRTPNIWYEFLGWPGIAQRRASGFGKAIHAVGWYGIVAIHFAPLLKQPYFLVPCLLLILNGIQGEWTQMKRVKQPTWRIGNHFLSLMSEFPRLRAKGDDHDFADDTDDQG